MTGFFAAHPWLLQRDVISSWRNGLCRSDFSLECAAIHSFLKAWIGIALAEEPKLTFIFFADHASRATIALVTLLVYLRRVQRKRRMSRKV